MTVSDLYQAAVERLMTDARKSLPWEDRLDKRYYRVMASMIGETATQGTRFYAIASGGLAYSDQALVALTDEGLYLVSERSGTDLWEPRNGLSVFLGPSEGLLGRDIVDVLLLSRGESLILYRCLQSVATMLLHEVEAANRRWREAGLEPPLESLMCSNINSVAGMPALSTGDSVMITLGATAVEFRLPGVSDLDPSHTVPYDSIASLTAALDRDGFPQMVLEGDGVSFWGTLVMVDYQDVAQILSRLQAEFISNSKSSPNSVDQPSPDQRPAADRLAQLRAAMDQGLITQEEFDTKRRDILDSF